MNYKNKPIPKSLHTVTVLVRMAIAYKETVDWGSETWAYLVDRVIEDLGLDDKPDTHGLRQAALKQLEE